MKNYYEILGISKDATTTEIKKAYSKLLRKYTPEKNPVEFQQIREAYEILKDEKTRDEYDAQNEYGEEIQMHINKAEEYMENKKYEVAIREYKKILVLQPSSDFARNRLGLALAYNNQLDDSLREFKKLIEMYPKNETYLMNIGHVYWRKGNCEQAKIYFFKAYDLDPINIQIVYDIVDLYLDKKEKREAIEFLKDCIHKNKNDYTLDILYYFKILQLYILEYNEEKIDEIIEKLENMATDYETENLIGGKMANLAYELYEAKLYKIAHKVSKSATLLLNDDKDVYAFYEECKKFDEIFTLYKKFQEDNNIIGPLKGPIHYFLYGDEYEENERKSLIEENINAINSYLDYETSYLVVNSINIIKKYYLKLYEYRKEMYDKIYNIAIKNKNIYDEFLRMKENRNICYSLVKIITLSMSNISQNEKQKYLDNILQDLANENNKHVYNSINIIKSQYKELYNLNPEFLDKIQKIAGKNISESVRQSKPSQHQKESRSSVSRNKNTGSIPKKENTSSVNKNMGGIPKKESASSVNKNMGSTAKKESVSSKDKNTISTPEKDVSISLKYLWEHSSKIGRRIVVGSILIVIFCLIWDSLVPSNINLNTAPRNQSDAYEEEYNNNEGQAYDNEDKSDSYTDSQDNTENEGDINTEEYSPDNDQDSTGDESYIMEKSVETDSGGFIDTWNNQNINSNYIYKIETEDILLLIKDIKITDDNRYLYVIFDCYNTSGQDIIPSDICSITADQNEQRSTVYHIDNNIEDNLMQVNLSSGYYRQNAKGYIPDSVDYEYDSSRDVNIQINTGIGTLSTIQSSVIDVIYNINTDEYYIR